MASARLPGQAACAMDVDAKKSVAQATTFLGFSGGCWYKVGPEPIVINGVK